jgi:hypothetical protein
LFEAAVKQTARRNSFRSSKDTEPGKGKTPETEPVNLKCELKGLYGDTDSAEEELLKETPNPAPSSTQTPTQAAENFLI